MTDHVLFQLIRFDDEHGSSQSARLIDVNTASVSHRLTFVPSMEIAVPGPRDDDELTALVGEARGGSSAAFDELARRVRNRVRRWARRYLTDGDEAEDVAQLVLVRMHERLDDFQGRSRFDTWLYRITRNIAVERRRSENRRSALLAREHASGEAVDSDAVVDDLDAAHLRRVVASYFEALSPRQRTVFELVELRGHAITDVAKQLGIEASTVRVLLLRARRTIRTQMLDRNPQLLEDHRS